MPYKPPNYISRRRTRFAIDGFFHDVTLAYTDEDRVEFHFPFDRELMNEIKTLEKRKWLGPPVNPDGPKLWDAPLTQRNMFRIAFLERHATGFDPYAIYDAPLIEFETQRPVRSHQVEMTSFAITRHYGILAGEPGVGKTLAMIEAMEWASKNKGANNWLYVCPKTVIPAIEREFRRWNSFVKPTFMTYDAFTSMMNNWKAGDPAPQGAVLDESSKVKNLTAQRTQAALALASAIRREHGMNGYCILMSGTPSPRSPADWFAQCEIAQPGFLKEGSIYDFNARLAVTAKREGASGAYNELLTWRDDPSKCAVCGELETHENHIPDEFGINSETADGVRIHEWKPSVNEVANLYARMSGLVLVKLKKDCIDLPDKIYDVIECPPSKMMLQVAKSLVSSAPNVITGLTLLRELSDGFQYREVPDGHQTCQVCNGTGVSSSAYDPEAAEGEAISDEALASGRVVFRDAECPRCGGKKIEPTFKTITEEVDCPKIEKLKDLLDEYEDTGRIVIFGGFTGSVDRCVAAAIAKDWHVIRVDGKGWRCYDTKGNPMQVSDPLSMFQDELAKYPRVAFVANADAAGMGLTLTASPVIVFYSNSFNAESRLQSEDRIHRLGMDTNRGARIIDLIHLPTDRVVLENLQKKRELQAMSMGDFSSALEAEAIRE